MIVRNTREKKESDPSYRTPGLNGKVLHILWSTLFSNLDPPLSVSKFEVELKAVFWRDIACVRLFNKYLIFCARQGMEYPNQVFIGQIQLSHDL